MLNYICIFYIFLYLWINQSHFSVSIGPCRRNMYYNSLPAYSSYITTLGVRFSVRSKLHHTKCNCQCVTFYKTHTSTFQFLQFMMIDKNSWFSEFQSRTKFLTHQNAILEINENATLVYSISLKHGIVHQNFVFIRQLNYTYSIKISFFVLTDCQYALFEKYLFKNKLSHYL